MRMASNVPTIVNLLRGGLRCAQLGAALPGAAGGDAVVLEPRDHDLGDRRVEQLARLAPAADADGLGALRRRAAVREVRELVGLHVREGDLEVAREADAGPGVEIAGDLS